MTIAAVSIKTESGDDYLFLYDELDSPSELVELIEGSMGEELAYAWSIDVQCLYGDCEAYGEALRSRRDELMGEDE
jgi:hypothetical protein